MGCMKDCFGEFSIASDICLPCDVYQACGYLHAIKKTTEHIDRLIRRSEGVPISNFERRCLASLMLTMTDLEKGYQMRIESQEGEVT